MKHFITLAFGVMGLALAACSNVEEPAEEATNPGQTQVTGGDKDVYATLNLKLPSVDGGRADGIANNGQEFGQDYENAVGKIVVVLATKDSSTGEYKYLTRATADAKPNTNGVGYNERKYVLNFSSSEMRPNPLNKPEEGSTESVPGQNIPTSTAYVFVYCNPSSEMITELNKLTPGNSFTDLMAHITDKETANLWTKNRFVMTNCEISQAVTIPDRATLVNDHNTPETAFKLGTVRVKRVAARFDFRLYKDAANPELDYNQYVIKDIDNETKVGVVELTEMAMFNISKDFYLLPRTNEKWNWSGKTTLCGDLEGFVQSCNANGFKQMSTLTSEYKDHYFYKIVNNPLDATAAEDDRLVWTSIRYNDWENNHDEDNNSQNDGNSDWAPDAGGYRIWRYATENTIPGGAQTGVDEFGRPQYATGNQKVGITTGVVFKGEFMPDNKTRWNGNAVYVHNNIVYGDYNALKEYVEKNVDTNVAADFKNVAAFQNVAADTDHKKSLLPKDETARANFKAYVAGENGKYTMYYFYYNRHQTNGLPSLMGQNEFGVVRNNVYKLAVTKCGRLGEPESTNKPDDPDEEENAYFTVNCIVMPWTVRVNNIEF